jgi:hypothetical protein
VNGEKVATQRLENNHPNRFFDATYLIPEKLMRDKTKITVKFQAHPNCLAGGIFGARLIKAGTGG